MATLLLIAYFAVLGVLALLGAHRLYLTYLALTARRDSPRIEIVAATGAKEWPSVVVQLPIYNEVLVVERLLRAAAKLSYPGALELQVLDDSTDETRAVVARVVHELAAEGAAISVLRRATREGYKAGALAHGLTRTQAELVAMFDADFIPPPDFLLRVVPVLLEDRERAMVQARWGHVNREASLLTRAQAIFLDGHFGIEHEARAASGRFFNFNGTAGVWRRSAIEASGGWSFDTITEDLDLSYRAQLAGLRFAYLDRVIAPAELPESWAAFRSQQSRWVRGSVETAKKHLARVLSARELSLPVRVEAAIHLTNNFAYLFMAVLAILLPIAVVMRSELGWRVPGGRPLLTALDLSMLGAGTCAMIVFYAVACARTEGRLRPVRLAELVLALCIGAGMSLSNAREVLAGLIARRSEFVRTPKRGDATREVALSRYRSRSPLLVPLLELAFAAYFGAALIYALEWKLFGALPFLLLYCAGFAFVGGGELLEARRRRANAVVERDAAALT